MKSKTKNVVLTFLNEYFGFLVIGLFAGLYFANYDHATYQAIVAYNVMDWLGEHLTISFLMRDSVITGFFGLIVAHILVQKINGDFEDKSAINQPIYGAIGGVIGPIAIYVSLVLIFDFKEALKAFPIVAATDIAFSLLVGSINHRSDSKTIAFLKLLAIADDIIIILISLFLPNPDHPFNIWGIPLIIFLVLVNILVFRVVNIPWKQFLLAVFLGALMWNALLFTGLHPILAFVLTLPFMVKTQPTINQASGRKALKIFEKYFKMPVDIGLFGFGFVSGGIVIDTSILFQPFTLIVLVSIVVGKSLFIPLAARFAGGNAYSVHEQFQAGILGGVGFTVSILMAQLLLKDQTLLREQATIGAVLSLVVVLFIQVVLLFFRKKFIS